MWEKIVSSSQALWNGCAGFLIVEVPVLRLSPGMEHSQCSVPGVEFLKLWAVYFLWGEEWATFRILKHNYKQTNRQTDQHINKESPLIWEIENVSLTTVLKYQVTFGNTVHHSPLLQVPLDLTSLLKAAELLAFWDWQMQLLCRSKKHESSALTHSNCSPHFPL